MRELLPILFFVSLSFGLGYQMRSSQELEPPEVTIVEADPCPDLLNRAMDVLRQCDEIASSCMKRLAEEEEDIQWH